MRHYYLLRNILLGTAAASLAAAPTAASVDVLLAAATSSSVSPPLHTSLRSLSTTTTTSSNPAYDGAMRHLQQESSNQDALDHCSGYTTAMVTCLLTQCVGQQPCDDDQDESTPEGT